MDTRELNINKSWQTPLINHTALLKASVVSGSHQDCHGRAVTKRDPALKPPWCGDLCLAALLCLPLVWQQSIIVLMTWRPPGLRYWGNGFSHFLVGKRRVHFAIWTAYFYSFPNKWSKLKEENKKTRQKKSELLIMKWKNTDDSNCKMYFPFPVRKRDNPFPLLRGIWVI